MQPSEHQTAKGAYPPSLFDVHRTFLELQSEFTSLLTMEPSNKAGECDVLAKALRQHLYAAKVHLLCTNVEGALSEIQFVRTDLDKLKSYLLTGATKEEQ
jgi:hypothetical protein